VSMQEAVSHSLFSYWNVLRGNRPAPRRLEIDPSRIADNLPDTFILERVDASTLRFRLTGTRITDAFGMELRGTNLIDLFDEADAPTIQRQIDLVAAHCAAGVFRISASNAAGQATLFEMLVLPLTHTQDAVDRFLGSIAPIEKPSWLGASALVNRKLVDHSIVWPDARSAMLQDHHAARQAPFLPARREARIVKSARRQFRVYVGGLCNAADER
jgi:hypothetical protein